MKKDLGSILKKEVKPALGCTGPIVVSYAVSVAKDAIGGKVQSVNVIVDRQTYSGSLTVGIPGISMEGVDIAAALGALAGDSKLGLEVLNKVSPEDEERAVSFLKNVVAKPNLGMKKTGLFVDAKVITDKGEGRAIISKAHDNVILIEANGKQIFKAENAENADEIDYSKDLIRKYGVQDFFDYVRKEPIEKLLFLREAVDMNTNLSQAGMKEGIGAGFGWKYSQFEPATLVTKAKARTAAASDARMAGLDIPAMSCATSGNAGITSSVPVISVAKDLGKSEEEMIRALALSFLITIFVKSHIGRLSSICSCSIAASMGVAAAVTMLLNGSDKQMEEAINSVGGGIGGVVCDGAKRGCSMKLASGLGVAIEAALLSIEGVSIPLMEGVVGRSADETIEAIGKVAQEGMIKVPETLFDVIMSRQD